MARMMQHNFNAGEEANKIGRYVVKNSFGISKSVASPGSHQWTGPEEGGTHPTGGGTIREKKSTKFS